MHMTPLAGNRRELCEASFCQSANRQFRLLDHKARTLLVAWHSCDAVGLPSAVACERAPVGVIAARARPQAEPRVRIAMSYQRKRGGFIPKPEPV